MKKAARSKAGAAQSKVAAPQARQQASDLDWRRHNVGRLLNDAIKRFESSILQQMDAAGYHGFSLSHIAITRNLDLEGTRATELARRAGITKQSVSELINQLEAGGIVERRPDPADGRAKIIYFSPAGLDWLNAFGSALQFAEQHMAKELGESAIEALKQALADYAYAPAQSEPT